MVPRRARASCLLLPVLLAGCGARSSPDEAPRPDGSFTASPSDAGTADAVSYRVVVLATALQRFAIQKEDEPRARCTTIVFVSPASIGRPGFDLALPGRWALERAWRGSCADDVWLPRPEGAVDATGGEGWGTWDEWPCAVSLEATLRFADDEPERLSVRDLATDDCP